MPLFQYFGWVGSFLLAALFAANWCVSSPIGRAPGPDVPLDRKINIRIHTDHKWPERVVFDTTGSALVQKADAGTSNEPTVVGERRRFDAFAEMAAIPVKPCFRPPCSAGQALERKDPRADKDSPFQIRSRMAARKDLTLSNPLHKPRGRS